MTIKLLCSLPVAALCFAVPLRADAMSFTAFQTRSSFENAVGTHNLDTQDFESITTAADFRYGSLSVGGLTLSDNSGFRARVGKAPAAVPTLNINDTSIAQLSARDSNGASIAFDSPITVFGATFAAISNGGRDTRFVFEDGSNLAIPFRGAGGELIDDGFFGFIADRPFNFLSFRRFDSSLADGFSVDNILFGTLQAAPTQTVPSPALLPGLIGMGVAALRRRKQTAAEEDKEA